MKIREKGRPIMVYEFIYPTRLVRQRFVTEDEDDPRENDNVIAYDVMITDGTHALMAHKIK